jgi:hypothetical protein
LDVAFDGLGGHFFVRFYVVPNAQVVAVLCHDHVRIGHPLHIRAKVENAIALTSFHVVQVKFHFLVAKQQELGCFVQLQPVDFQVVLNLRDCDICFQVDLKKI